MAKTLHYNFAATPSLEAVVGPTLAITRATSATMVDADGYIRQVQSGEARFPGASWSDNSAIQSQTFDNASWSKTRLSVSANATTDWEYLVKTYPLLGNDGALTQTLNKLGKQQWELVNCAKGNAKLTCIFKRPAKVA